MGGSGWKLLCDCVVWMRFMWEHHSGTIKLVTVKLCFHNLLVHKIGVQTPSERNYFHFLNSNKQCFTSFLTMVFQPSQESFGDIDQETIFCVIGHFSPEDMSLLPPSFNVG